MGKKLQVRRIKAYKVVWELKVNFFNLVDPAKLALETPFQYSNDVLQKVVFDPNVEMRLVENSHAKRTPVLLQEVHVDGGLFMG